LAFSYAFAGEASATLGIVVNKIAIHEPHLGHLVDHRRDVLHDHRRYVLELAAVEPDSAKYDPSCPACCGLYRGPDLFHCLRVSERRRKELRGCYSKSK
jgi:hypothetical protein